MLVSCLYRSNPFTSFPYMYKNVPTNTYITSITKRLGSSVKCKKTECTDMQIVLTHIILGVELGTDIKCLNRKCIILRKEKKPKTNNPFWIWWQLISNKLGHVYQSSLLLTTVYKCVGTKEKSCRTFVNVMSHSCLISDFSCSAVLDLWCIFVTNNIYIYI